MSDATGEAESYWFRVGEGRYAPPLDEWERPCGVGRVFVHMHSFRVLRVTASGVWLDMGGGCGKRFVRRDARRRFACPSPEEALESFRARKTSQIRKLRLQTDQAIEALSLASDWDSSLDVWERIERALWN